MKIKDTCPLQKQDFVGDNDRPKHDRFCKGSQCAIWDTYKECCCFMSIAKSLTSLALEGFGQAQ